MIINLTFNSEPPAKKYLRIKHKGEILLLEDFAKKYDNAVKVSALDSLVKKCLIIYKDKEYTYDELKR